jgi:transcriptional regulator with GAF, ATPase, and Fis domain
MTVLSLSSSRVRPEVEIEQVAKLAVMLSGQLTRMQNVEDLVPALGRALDEVAAAVQVDGCQLVEFTEAGGVHTVYYPAGAAAAVRPDAALALDGWLVERLAAGEVVAISRPDEVPAEALSLLERVRPTGACCVLGIPAMAAERVICALAIDSTRAPRRWTPLLIERLQLLAEIFAATLQRRRHEAALRASVAVIEQLNARLEADNVYLKEEIKSYHDFDDVVGESAPLRLALARLSQVAPTSSNVLLLGETGTGKELFARALHARSRRQARPLVRVNCAALPPTLVESELFGHEKGAFTGAVATRQGRFELADGGTIFLDEIGDLTPEVQVKFLRVLQEGEFERVGSSRTKRVDVRVIAATHRDLEAAVAAGTFRADLYYRLSVYPIHLPSLRERREDIPRLVWFFIQRHQRELGRQISKVPQSVMDALQHHSWPGNVRELENVVERAMIASSGDLLQLDEPLAFKNVAHAVPEGVDDLDTVQRMHIESVLQRCGWRINGSGNAAERLGVHPNTLRFRMKKLGVVCPGGRGRNRATAAASV